MNGRKQIEVNVEGWLRNIRVHVVVSSTDDESRQLDMTSVNKWEPIDFLKTIHCKIDLNNWVNLILFVENITYTIGMCSNQMAATTWLYALWRIELLPNHPDQQVCVKDR